MVTFSVAQYFPLQDCKKVVVDPASLMVHVQLDDKKKVWYVERQLLVLLLFLDLHFSKQ